MISFEQNLYWREQHNLQLDELTNSCISIVNYAKTHLQGTAETTDIPLIGDTYNGYNLLLYPRPQIHNLYHSIRSSFRQIEPSGNWWIKTWANVFENRTHYDWHQHHTHYLETNSNYPSYHGIFCVAGTDTATTYRNFITQEQAHIHQTPGQLTFIANHPDWYHRTWPYKHEETRITVAFNVIHEDSIDAFKYPNHWLPL
jgi:hypothetical protein